MEVTLNEICNNYKFYKRMTVTAINDNKVNNGEIY